jgi:DNA-binding NarL/FixJ family response regulator
MGSMQKILIVDDHPLYREGMASALRQLLPEIEVLGAESAEAGLALLDDTTDMELVLIDVKLPGMDGFAALSLYASRYPAVARMLISGQDDAELVRRAFAAGASGFIHKSMTVMEIVHAIQHVLEGGVFVPDDQRNEGIWGAKHKGVGASVTLRQLEVLRLLGEGHTNKEIAGILHIAESTAKAHVAAILETLGVDNRTQAVVEAQRAGLLAPRT